MVAILGTLYLISPPRTSGIPGPSERQLENHALPTQIDAIWMAEHTEHHTLQWACWSQSPASLFMNIVTTQRNHGMYPSLKVPEYHHCIEKIVWILLEVLKPPNISCKAWAVQKGEVTSQNFLAYVQKLILTEVTVLEDHWKHATLEFH